MILLNGSAFPMDTSTLNKHARIFIYVLDECQVNLLRSSSGGSPSGQLFLLQLSSHRCRRTPTEPVSSLLYFLIVLCTDFSYKTSNITITSLKVSFIFVSPVYDKQQVFSGWREFSHRNFTNYQSSWMNQISFALNVATI